MGTSTEKHYMLKPESSLQYVGFEANTVYKGDFKPQYTDMSVAECVKAYPNHWEEAPAPLAPKNLTEQQYKSLVQKFYDLLMLDMTGVAMCRETAEITVREWAETNQIQLP